MRVVFQVISSSQLLSWLFFICVCSAQKENESWNSTSVTNSSVASNWQASYTRARALVARMTNEEKENLTYGYTPASGCSGESGSAPRVGFPGLCLQDAENGVRSTDLVNAYASSIHLGASWNAELAYSRAQFLGKEFKVKGVNALLGPVAGPLGRIALGGRNWEGTTNDPYLASVLTYESVRGMQESVMVSVKHYIGNEQETNRQPRGDIFAVSSNIDDKTLHELYLWPFQSAILAGAGNVMCSYNRINNTYGCENTKLLNEILRGELGFQGFVLSDWGAQHSSILSAEAGLEMAMPDSPIWKGQLSAATANGTLSQGRLDEMAIRIIAAWYQLGQDEESYPSKGIGMPINLLAPHKKVDARDPLSKGNLLQQAIEGHVLVKNINNALPFQTPKILSIFGYSATDPLNNNIPSSGTNAWTFGLQSLSLDGSYIPLFYNTLAESNYPGTAYNGTIISGGGSGANTASYMDSPLTALTREAYDKNIFLLWDLHTSSPSVNAESDACLVFLNAYSLEGFDRPALNDEYGDTLVTNVADSCGNTIVIIHNAGPRLVDPWIDHPNVTAVLFAHLPGQDSGRGLTEILFGRQSPSGRMPYTLAKQAEDYGDLLGPDIPEPSDPSPQSNFSEGIYIDYKSFIHRNVTPRFEFGYGLTYTSFTYDALSISVHSASLPARPDRPAGTHEGGNPSLFAPIASISMVLTNTGSARAQEVAQLYIGLPSPDEPERQLRGFRKISLAPAQSRVVTFHLTRKDLSIWHVHLQDWVLLRGSYAVFVGASVLDVRLRGELVI